MSRPQRNRVIGLAFAFVFALVACGGGSGNTTGTEVFLEPAAKPGRDAFTKTVALAKGDTTATTGSPLATATGDAIPSTTGSTLALYGGRRNESSCNKERLIQFLEAFPDKATAWAGVLGIPPDQIRQYVGGLAPVILIRDTRVTNHGYANGRATARPAVLQAGTAVLVDSYGVPRVKCGCGNPLTEPLAVTKPVYAGSTWADFSPSTTVVVVSPPAVMTVIVLVDIGTGATFGRPVGTDGTADVDVAEDGTVITPPASALNDSTVSGTYTVRFQGDQSGPCQAWPKGTGSMTVTATDHQLAITLTYPNGSMFGYQGYYTPADGHWVAPDVQFGRNPIGGTFVIADGVVAIPDGLRTTQNVHGAPCVGAFTATKKP